MNKNTTVKELKKLLENAPDNMCVVIPVLAEENTNNISGFRFVRTAGILKCECEKEQLVLCLSTSSDDNENIETQAKKYDGDVACEKVLA